MLRGMTSSRSYANPSKKSCDMVRFVKKSTNQEVVTQNVGETKKNCKDNKSTKTSPKASQGVENIKKQKVKKLSLK